MGLRSPTIRPAHALLGVLCLAASCEFHPVTAPAPGTSERQRVLGLADSCVGGTPHAGDIGTETWRATDSPHQMLGVSVIGTLTIEAGARVCGAPSTALMVLTSGKLVVRGSESAPVVFTSADPGARWAGIASSGTLQAAHARLEYARDTMIVVTGGTLQLDSSRIRQSAVGLSLSGGVTTITGSVIDTVARAAILLQGSAGLTLRQSIVRHADLGLFCHGGHAPAVLQTRIEYSRIGIFDCSFSQLAELRFLGNESLAFIDLETVRSLLQDPATADSLRGLLYVTYGKLDGEMVIPSRLALRAAFGGISIGGSGTLQLQPGGIFNGAIRLGAGVRLVARGTATEPVTLSLASLDGAERTAFLGGSPEPSVLSHVNIVGLRVVADSGRALLLDSSRVGALGSVVLRSPGSRVLASTIEYAGDSAGVTLGAPDVRFSGTMVRRALGAGWDTLRVPGIRVEAAGVRVDSCEVSGSAGDGILVTAGAGPGTVIHQCNLVNNGGFGVHNLGRDSVDARFNWWGDAAGPTGPAGDGVAGAVDASGALSAPVRVPVATMIASPPLLTVPEARASRRARGP